jgi:hypothetical protein
MPQVSWSATPSEEYWIDVSLGGHHLQVLIDTGFIDPRGQVGFSVDESLYDSIKQSGGFRNYQAYSRVTADGQMSRTESGSLDAQLIAPQTRIRVGPVVHVSVLRGVSGVPNRVGTAFFHRLAGCKVIWDLDKRTWSVEYP